MHVLVLWIKVEEKNRNISYLSTTLHKMQNEKWKGKTLFSAVIFAGATRMFASHIKFIFLSLASFQTIKHFSLLIAPHADSLLVAENSSGISLRRSIDDEHSWHSAMTNLAFACVRAALLISPLFRSGIQAESPHGDLALVVQKHFVFAHKSRHSNDKRLCIHQVYVSMELFNFPLVVVVSFASNHRQATSISWTSGKKALD